MKRIMKNIMFYAALIIFTMACGFCMAWNFMHCNDLVVWVIGIGYIIVLTLLSNKIEEGLK